MSDTPTYKIIDDYVRVAVRARLHRLGFDLNDMGQQWLDDQRQVVDSPILSIGIVAHLIKWCPGWLCKLESEE